MTEYISHGVPLQNYEPTAEDQRAQRKLEDLRAWARAEAAKLPRWSDEQFAEVEKMLRHARKNPPPQMPWRVRLFCGHVLEVARHADSKVPIEGVSDSATCGSCGGSVQLIVAFEPVGPVRVADAPGTVKRARRSASSSAKPKTKAELEAENAVLRAKLERLRRSVNAAPTGQAEPE